MSQRNLCIAYSRHEKAILNAKIQEGIEEPGNPRIAIATGCFVGDLLFLASATTHLCTMLEMR